MYEMRTQISLRLQCTPHFFAYCSKNKNFMDTLQIYNLIEK